MLKKISVLVQAAPDSFSIKNKDLASESPAFLELSIVHWQKFALIIFRKADQTKDGGWCIWIQHTKKIQKSV